MFKVIQWISIVLCWVAVGMNIYAMIRLNRCRKWYEKKNIELNVKEDELKATEKYFLTMIAACTEFLEVARKEKEKNNNETDAL